jgi:dTDP-4-dehydrorhamnose reductase
MNVLITGGNGYIAKSLYHILNGVYNVTSISRNDFDLTDYSKTCSWFEGKTFDAVIHTAINGGSRLQQDDQTMFDKNMSMFTNLISNKHCFSKLISFGSGAELFHGDTPYANSKREIAKQILDLPNFYNLRIFGVFDHDELDTRFIKSNIIRYLRR